MINKIFYNMGKSSKKAAVGLTLTWVAAFLIIFFIMFLFLAGTGILSAEKKLFNDDEINSLHEQSENFENQRMLTLLLESEADDKKIVDLLLSNNDDNEKARVFSENFLKELVENKKNREYIFSIDYTDKEKDDILIHNLAYGLVRDVGTTSERINERLNSKDKTASVKIISGHEINIKLYLDRI